MKVQKIVETYGLPRNLASEILAEETMRALRTKWQAWLLLLATFATYAWLQFSGPTDNRSFAIWFLLGGAILWRVLGRTYARPAIHRAARAKAARLSGAHP